MNNLEARVVRLETLVGQLQAQLATLTTLLGQTAQNQWTPMLGGGGGGGGGIYVVQARATGTVAGTWSGSAPSAGGSFSGTVYQVSGTGTITNLGTQTCVNWMPAALVNGLACYCMADGAGDYATISQSCS